MHSSTEKETATFGLLGCLLGIVSLVVILIQMSAFFEPEAKSTGTFIGEIAAEIKQSAARALAGEPAPAPVPLPPDYGQVILIAALCGAGLAAVLGAIGLYRHEPHRLSYLALGFGTSAFVMQFAFWVAVLICGVVLLISIISNLDSIFS